MLPYPSNIVLNCVFKLLSHPIVICKLCKSEIIQSKTKYFYLSVKQKKANKYITYRIRNSMVLLY